MLSFATCSPIQLHRRFEPDRWDTRVEHSLDPAATTAQSHEEDTRLADRVIMWYERGQGGNRGCNDDQIKDCKKTSRYFGMA